MQYIDESQAYELYDEMLDECNDEIVIGYIRLSPSTVLKECDPIAYQCGFNDWLDSAELTTDESEEEEA
jgi:hypothetical protein